MRRLGLLATAAVTAGAVLLAATPASAATRVLHDPKGDAPAFLDVTALKVRNGTRSLVAWTTIPGFDPAALDRSGAGTGDSFSDLILVVDVRGAVPGKYSDAMRPQEFLVEVGPGAPGQPIDQARLVQIGEDDPLDVPCDGLRARVHAGEIVAIVPQSCFGRVKGKHRGDVEVAAIVQGDVGPQGERDDTRTTRWIARG